MPESQTFKNHSRVVPMYHIGVFFPLALNFVWSVYQLRYGVTAGGVIGILTAIALLLMFVSIRGQILTVQDRVIRLEMRHRLRELLPADACARTMALPIRQIIALRFASDTELPGLVREVLGGSLTTGKEIKMRVKDWQADYLRA